MRRADSLEKTLMLGGIGGRRKRGQQRVRWLDGITDLMDVFEWTPGVGDGQGGLACCRSWGRKGLDRTERLNWTELNWRILCSIISPTLQTKNRFRERSWGSNPGMSESKVQPLIQQFFGVFLMEKIPEDFLQRLLVVFEPRASEYQGISLLFLWVTKICPK